MASSSSSSTTMASSSTTMAAKESPEDVVCGLDEELNSFIDAVLVVETQASDVEGPGAGLKSVGLISGPWKKAVGPGGRRSAKGPGAMAHKAAPTLYTACRGDPLVTLCTVASANSTRSVQPPAGTWYLPETRHPTPG
ncbi:hypothetical protein EYF80_035404 [Liparis tanakae]|uniref:Uncharacterized protein n=1 Tax=Liparis tanakae TaxID=230148 RepID=A0A4Z2GLL5_9TELE|nr:hypothetical protein EYF80_035404 [Liparis tanakae]